MALPRRFLRLPIAVLLVNGTVSAWLIATDHVARSVGVLLLGLLSLLAFGLGWALGHPGRRWRRLGALLLAGLVLGAVGRLLLRYDGSADGTALPRLAWRWQAGPLPPKLAPPPAAASAVSPAPEGLEDWPGFMGPGGDGQLPAPDWQTDWRAHPPREVWRQPAGLGWSGFAVTGNRAITQEQRGDDECVACYEACSGRLLWLHAERTRFSEPLGGDGPRATPAVAADGRTVFTLGGTGVLNCLEVATGRLIWRREVLAETGSANLTYGKSGSPLLVNGWVVVTGGAAGPTLLAFRQDDGAPVWKGGDEPASYSTPALRTLAGRAQLVSVNAGSVTGHDPATGAVWWRFAWPGDYPKVGQPCAAGPDRLLVTASYGQKSHLIEVRAGAGQALTAEAVWTASSPRTKFSSATRVGERAYALDEGTLVALDLRRGERLWRQGRYGFGQHLQVGCLLLIQAESGEVVLVEPEGQGARELGRLRALSSKTWNPPTLAGRWLLLRNDREMVAYELAPRGTAREN